MAENKIRVLLIHAFPETTAYISALLGLERDVALLGSLTRGGEAPAKVAELQPDVVLMGSDLPDADSATLVRQIVSRHPRTGVVVLVASDDPEDLRRYMQAGARSFLVLPFSSAQLVETIREVHRRVQNIRVPVARPAPKPSPAQPAAPRARVVAVFGPKGGVGKTMLAVNLAIALRHRKERSVVLVDANFSFGDVHLFLNIKPEHTIIDFVERGAEGDLETLQRVLQKHSSGIYFLARPERPEHAEIVTADNFRRMLDLLGQAYEFIVVDCAASYDDRTLMVLDRSEAILLVVTPEVSPLFNASVFLDLAQALGYPKDRVRVVLNRHDSQSGISVSEAEAALGRPIEFRIPSRGRELLTTSHVGVPVVLAQPNSDISRCVNQIAEAVSKRADGK